MPRRLEARIREEIKKRGIIALSEYIEYCLFDLEEGYYTTKNPIGKNGDFITSPEISQIFGELIGLFIAENWLQNAREAKVELVELGPGKGTLMNDFLRATKKVPKFHESINVKMIDTNPTLRKIQQDVLKEYNFIEWYESMEELGEDGPPIYIVANEFFDVFPIDQYVYKNSKWHKRHVSLAPSTVIASELSESGNPVPYELKIIDLEYHEKPPLIGEYLKANKLELLEGFCYEYSELQIKVFEKVLEILDKRKGIIIIIDYDNKAYNENTLQALRKHEKVSILEHIGEADITAHVSLDFLARMAKNYLEELQISGPITQKDFLLTLGCNERHQQLMEHASPEHKAKLKSSYNRLINDMRDLFRVLVLYNL